MATDFVPGQGRLFHHFTHVEEQRLADEDTAAFTNVCGILLVLVTGGLVLGLVSVLAIVALR